MLPGQSETGWRYVALGDPAPVITRADILITTTEIRRFEEAHGLSKKVAVQSPNLKYDWDEFYQAMIVHIHERGLPATQADLVGDMQNWFIGRSKDGDAPEESTIRKRIMPIWRALREEA